MKNLLKIDKILAKSTIYYKVETNFFIKALNYIPSINFLILALEELIIKTDKLTNFKFLFFYDYLRLFSYIRGYIDRKKIIQSLKWIIGMIKFFNKKTVLITGGTGSFGAAMTEELLNTKISEIRIFSRDEKKQDDMRKKYSDQRLKFYLEI